MSIKKTSKFLSLILRHKPQTVGIELDANGWVEVDVLLDALKASGHEISREQLDTVVRENDKQRFVIADGRIRANQGHSVDIDLGLDAVEPPSILYHGTASRFLDKIEVEGLEKMNRQHVHLSPDLETAMLVGARHGKAMIFRVAAGCMYVDGFQFYLSKNGVWLVDSVPRKYLEVLSDDI